ncbi:hypothetical protein [Peribacillus frigoritolerans]|uniref:hypothetical protein n=1 Tax=Peribacillus frigoritolerans TaxID=450367 RepID=UPI002E20C0C8|nr:hypothetical protein [Peribacillus frigoritolerans]
MSLVRVLSIDSLLPVVRISDNKTSWSAAPKKELGSYMSNFEQVIDEIVRYDTTQEMVMEHDEDCSEDTQRLENNQKQGELGEVWH